MKRRFAGIALAILLVMSLGLMSLGLMSLGLMSLDLVQEAQASTDTAAGVPGRPQPVLAYYYIWYNQSSWDRAKTDYPSIGRYSSDDAEVMRRHIQLAKGAGISGFIVSWKSSPTNDRRLATLATVARSEDFTLAIMYEGLDFYRNPLPTDLVRADLQGFAGRYGSDPVFNVFGKALLIFSGSWAFSARDVASVTAPVRDRVLVLASEKSVKDYERLAGDVDGNAYYWSSINPDRDVGAGSKLAAIGAAVHRHHGRWIAPFAPGFDARALGGNRVVERRDGETLRQQYAAAAGSSPDAFGLISWNEFSENSHVEPSTRYGDRSLLVLRSLTGAPAPALGPLAEDSSSSEGSFDWIGPTIIGSAIVILLGGTGVLLLLLLRRRGHRVRLPVLVLAVVVAGSSVAGVLSWVTQESSAPAAGAGIAGTVFYAGPKPVRSPASVTVATAGDIACAPDPAGLNDEENNQDRACQQRMTADLVRGRNPDAVLVLGDNQYPNGSLDRYRAGYQATWGEFKSITYPVAGNHEYGTPGARGYFDYFGSVAGAPGSGFYSYELAGWHIIALNSECQAIDGCQAGSRQEQWLRADLAAHPAQCTLAYWHKPRFSSGTHGNDYDFDAFWRALYEAGAEIVLSGHDHDYERFAPLTPDGSVDPERGIRQFVVGIGGHSQRRIHKPVPGSEVRVEGVYGVLDLTLRPGGYDWHLVPEPSAQVEDSGSTQCH